MLKRLFLSLVLASFLAVPSVRAFGAEESAAGTAVEKEKETLLPSMHHAHEWVSALWVIIIFLIMLAILYPTAWKNVLAGLKAREQRIRNDIAEAEALHAKAEATLRDYNTQLATAADQVRDLLQKAQADAQQIAAKIRTDAEQEGEERKERAFREIESAKRQAINQIYEQAADLSTSIAEKILRRSLNADDQRDLVRSSLEQLGTKN